MSCVAILHGALSLGKRRNVASADSKINGGIFEYSGMINSGLPFLTLNIESSYPDSLYFFNQLKKILGEIEYSSQI